MKFKTSDNKNANCLLVDSLGYRVNKFEHVWGRGPCEVGSRLNTLDLSVGPFTVRSILHKFEHV